VLTNFAVLGVATGVWLARIPAIKQDLRLSDGQLGVALLAAPAGLILAAALASRLMDRTGSRIPAAAGAPVVALTPVLLGLAGSQASLMAALFVFGLAGGMLDVAMNTQAARVERGYGRPLLTSFHACYSVGGLAGALTGAGFAWAQVRPVVNFAVAGLPLAVAALAVGRWLLPGRAPAAGEAAAPAAGPGSRTGQAGPERRPAAGSGSSAPPAGPRTGPRPGWTRPLLLLGLLSFCALLGEGAADGWTTVYLHDNLGASTGLAALGYAGFSVTMAAGRLAGDRLAVRFGAAVLVRGGGLLAAAGLAGALISRAPAGAVAGFALFGAGLSCTFPQLISAAASASPARPASGIGRVAGAGYAGLLAGPVLIGGLAGRFGLLAALWLPVGLALLLAAGAAAITPRAALPR